MFKTIISSAACILALLCSSVMAQETSNRVSTETDWSIFVESNPTECWAVTEPKETVNTKDGSVVSVRRGKILLFVFYRPSDNVKGQVAFTGGYPFAKGRPISMNVDGVNYKLLVDDEWAWPPSAADDAKIIAAMKRGAQAIVTAQSERGTVTKDTFSLQGFTAAVKDAEKRCAG